MALTTVRGIDAVAFALPAVPTIETVIFPVAMELDVVKLIVVPPEGTLIGNVEVVVSPVGSVPKEIDGEADVPVSAALTDTKKESLAEMVSEEGLTWRDSVAFDEDPPPPPLPPVPPPPQPAITAVAKKIVLTPRLR